MTTDQLLSNVLDKPALLEDDILTSTTPPDLLETPPQVTPQEVDMFKSQVKSDPFGFKVEAAERKNLMLYTLLVAVISGVVCSVLTLGVGGLFSNKEAQERDAVMRTHDKDMATIERLVKTLSPYGSSRDVLDEVSNTQTAEEVVEKVKKP